MLVRRTTAAVLAAFAIFVLDFALIGASGSVGVVAALLPGHAAHVLDRKSVV